MHNCRSTFTHPRILFWLSREVKIKKMKPCKWKPSRKVTSALKWAQRLTFHPGICQAGFLSFILLALGVLRMNLRPYWWGPQVVHRVDSALQSTPGQPSLWFLCTEEEVSSFIKVCSRLSQPNILITGPESTSNDCQGPLWVFPLLEEPEDQPIWGLIDLEI